MQRLSALCMLFGPSSAEGHVRSWLISQGEEWENKWIDQSGNLVFLKKGNSAAKKVMICAGMDQSSYIISKPGDCDNPLASLTPATQSNDWSNPSQSIQSILVSASGELMLRQNDEKGEKNQHAALFLTSSLEKEDEKVGEKAVCWGSFSLVKDLVIAPALSNRAACYCLLKAMEAMRQPVYDTYFVFTCASLQGGRGALWATKTLKPDVLFSLDAVLAQGLSKEEEQNKTMPGLKKGPAIIVKDRGGMLVEEGIEYAVHVAKKHNLDVQWSFDEKNLSQSSAVIKGYWPPLVCAIGIPILQMYTGQEICSQEDLAQTEALISYLAMSLSKQGE